MNNEELPVATDEECSERRSQLVSAGIIKPMYRNLSTRRKLIDLGIINPRPKYVSSNVRHECGEEGEYNPQPIKNDEEYNRRKDLYLWMVSDLLRTRRELKLELGRKKETDPDWYF